MEQYPVLEASQSIIFASLRSILIWIGLFILMPKRNKWYNFIIYVLATAIFTYTVFSLIDQLARPAMFALVLLIMNLKRDGWSPEWKKNLFYTAIVFMTMIWSNSLAALISTKVSIYHGGYLFTGTFYLGTIYFTTFGLIINAIISIVLLFLVRKMLIKTKISALLLRTNTDYDTVLATGMSIILFAYYIGVLSTFYLNFDCTGSVYMEAIYITLLSFITAGLIFLYGTVMSKDIGLNRYKENLKVVNAKIREMETHLSRLSSEVLRQEGIVLKGQEYIEEKEREMRRLDASVMKLGNVQQRLRDLEHGHNDLLIGLAGAFESRNEDVITKIFSRYNIKIFNVIEHQEKFSEISNLVSAELWPVRKLLLAKVELAVEKGVNFGIEVPSEVYATGVDILDFIEILGIWINNAIEEAVKTESKWVHVSFIKGNNWEEIPALECRVSNSCSAESIKIMRNREHGYSSKGEDRGRGLVLVEKILENYDNVYRSTELIEKNDVKKCVQLLEIEFLDEVENDEFEKAEEVKMEC